MWIVCMIPPEKSDTCGLMLRNPDRDLFMDSSVLYDLSRIIP